MTPPILHISTHHNDRSVGLAVRSRRNMPVLTMVLWIIITFPRAASTYCCLEDWWPAPSGRPTLTTQSTPRRCRTDASSQPSISTINLAPTTTLLFIIKLPSLLQAHRYLMPPPPPRLSTSPPPKAPFYRHFPSLPVTTRLQRHAPTNLPPSSSSHPPLSTMNLLLTTAVLPLVLVETVQVEVSHGVVAASYQ